MQSSNASEDKEVKKSEILAKVGGWHTLLQQDGLH
jgi:hypothetical protein